MFENLRVLIVDDFRTMRSIMRQALTQCGITDVIECQDGKDAWDYLAHYQEDLPDLILCDLHMAEMDGMQLTAKIRRSKRKRIKDIPIAILTGEKDRFVHNVVTQVGATRILTKPISPGDLEKEIAALIGFRSA